MLKWLHLKNLALVDEADLELSSGFNAITGETGAGKSVLMNGLSLLLGGRFDKSSIRQGEDRCEISGEFVLSSALAMEMNPFLEEYGFEPLDGADPRLLIRRVFTASGGRIFLNSSPASAQILKRLGELLVDIHTPGEALGLLKGTEQLKALDRFARIPELLESCADAWDRLLEARRSVEAFQKEVPSADEAADLKQKIQEIEKASPRLNEDRELDSLHSAASNSKVILEIAAGASAALSESDDSIKDRLSAVYRLLRGLENIDTEFAEKFLEKCDLLSDAVNDLSSEISDRASTVEMDEAGFIALEDRMRILQTLKRKYGPELSDVLSFLDNARTRLEYFENSELRRTRLAESLSVAERVHSEACIRLSAARKQAAERLAESLKAEIIKLGFKRAGFEVLFESCDPGRNGSDRIDFLFTANPGVPLKPLRHVASSGELSRVMLAVKTVLAEVDRIETLVFDEIDANIGGETAVTVAAELALLGKKKQILCISHLPQVAARASRHFVVEKRTTAESAVSSVAPVEHDARVNELARMLGGGAAARRHAATFLNDSAEKA